MRCIVQNVKEWQPVFGPANCLALLAGHQSESRFDPQGNVALAISGRGGGGLNNGARALSYSGGGNITLTRQPTIFTLHGSTAQYGVSGGIGGLGGSVGIGLGGSVSITGGVAGGLGTFGGASYTNFIPLICN